MVLYNGWAHYSKHSSEISDLMLKYEFLYCSLFLYKKYKIDKLRQSQLVFLIEEYKKEKSILNYKCSNLDLI